MGKKQKKRGFIEKFRDRAFRKTQEVAVHTVKKSLRIPIVPTYFGLAYIGTLIVLFLWVANHQINLGYAFVFMLAILGIFTATITASNLAEIEINCLTSPNVFCGEQAVFNIAVKAKNRTASFFIKNNFDRVECEKLIPDEKKILLLRQNTSTRGKLKIQPLEIATTIPLDLFISWNWFLLKGEIIVYPKPDGNLPLPYNYQGEENKDEQLKFNSLGEEELDSLRQYRQGDSLSRVAWKQSARTGELLVKQFSGELNSEEVVLDYDRTEGNIEERLSQLAKWVVEAEELKLNYALKLPNYFSPLSQGKSHYHHCLTTLALF
ncbi:MAG: DUF58 domain-containing protein [Cardiobacteriaceae bacterium]|nr:DUF58 domain-containing protein [Cardiobacteriaceae bacterium]